MELMIEPFGIGSRLFVFGAGHVAEPTVRLAVEVGFEVTVLDSGEQWATAERFPGARIKIGDTDVLAGKLRPAADDFIVVMTATHDEDYRITKQLLRKPFYYLGVIGSARKAAEIKRLLARDGFTEDEIMRMTCPIGMDIGSHTPAEIAVSVAAQLIQRRNRRESSSSSG